jgi:Mismatch repair ATPase (MutS family)
LNDWEGGEPCEVPITDMLDLHAFAPRDMKAALEAWLEAAHVKGYTVVRIIHGRGIGVQREMVRQVLAAAPFVVSFDDASPGAGGWGATVAELAPPHPDQESKEKGLTP